MSRRSWREFDWVLLVTIILLSIYGVVMISSAVKGDPELVTYAQRQIVYVGVGLALLFLLSAIDYHALGTLTAVFYAIVLIVLALVGVIGERIFGAQSWINFFGLFPIQPSELAKVALALTLSKFLANRHDAMGRVTTVGIGLILLAPLLVLVFLEPDLGTAIVLAVEAIIIFVAAGLPIRYMALGIGAAALAAPAFWSMLADHQRKRLIVFVDPTADPDSYFNVEQALVSVGSGGLLGKGYGQGTQSQLHFLRVRHTDFIFSVIAEELGFVGAVLLLLLIFIIIMRLWRISSQARDPFGRFLAAGITSIILFQTIVNVGMNMALLPVTGLPLPFVSYGGNAMLSLFLMIGMAQSVAMRRRKIEF